MTLCGAVDPELLVLKRRELMLRRQRMSALKVDALPFYKPHEKQVAFHAAGTLFRRRMVRAGNRFGKSLMGCAEDCAWLRRERVWVPEDAPERRGGIPQHPIKLLTVTTDWDKVDEIFTSQRGEMGKAWRYLPRDGFVKGVRRNHSGAIDTIECANGSLWRFDTVKSFMANPMGLESSDWDAIHVDEPCPEQMWKAMSRGLIDRNGAAWFTLTPLREPWINDLFFPQDTGGLLRDGVWAVTGAIYDNPYLSREAIAEFEASLTEEEKQCRLHGIPLHLAGLVYKEFSWDKHVLKRLPEGWKQWNQPPKSYTIYYAIDPHPQTPHAVLFCAVSPLGQRFYFMDIFKHCSIGELARLIHEVVDGYPCVTGRIDPLAYINDPITETNMAMELATHGIYVEKATKALAQGILRVQAALAKEPVYFTPACKRTLWEIQRYCWDEGKDRPVDEDDHTMECFYRIELMEPRWVDMDEGASRSVPELTIDRAELTLTDVSLGGI